MPAGRPTDYRPEYCEQVYRLALLGLTDTEMASVFDVSEPTFNRWKSNYPEFFKSIKDGKDKADAKLVEKLYHRAMGYSHPDVHISNYQGEITVTEITKHYPPDTPAAIFWLKNRQRGKWSNKDEDTKKDQTVNVILHPDGYTPAE